MTLCGLLTAVIQSGYPRTSGLVDQIKETIAHGTISLIVHSLRLS